VSCPTFLPLVGGAELGIHEVYHRIGQNHDVTIVTPRLAQAALADFGATDYESPNYDVRHLLPEAHTHVSSLIARVLQRTSLPYMWRITRVNRAEPLDVINFHYIAPHGAAVVAASFLSRTPTVLSLVGRSDVVHLLPQPRRWWARRVIAAATLVAPNSAFYLRGEASPGQTSIIPYGVDVSEFNPSRRSTAIRDVLGIGDGDTMLLCVQRLADVKRVDLLLRILTRVLGRHPGVILVVVGQGPEQERLMALADELGVAGNVRFTGYLDSERLPDYYASADVFVFHSMLETFGIVFIQAMASGLPIVAADTSCVSDVLSTSNALIVAPGDLDAFADAICLLIEDPATRETLGAANRARAEAEFDWDAVARDYEALLGEAIAVRGSNA